MCFYFAPSTFEETNERRMLGQIMDEKWIILFLGWLGYVCFGLINAAMAPMVTPIMGELSLTNTQMGVVMGAWQLVYIFSAQPLGLLTDRIGIYWSLILGIFIISVSSLLRGFSGGFIPLFITVALFGIGGPLISIGTPKLVATWFVGAERGTASGINASGSIVGTMIALSLTNSLVLPSLGSWRGVFFFYGLVSLLIMFIWILFGNKKHFDVEETSSGSPVNVKEGGLNGFFRNLDLWLLVLVGIVFFFSTHALKSWLPRIIELKGYSSEQAGYAASLISIAGLVGNLVVPRMSYRLESKKIMITLILLLCSVSVFVLGVSQGVPLWLGIILSGFSIRSIMPLLTLILMDMPLVGSKRIGLASGFLFSLGEIGGFLGPFMMGYLIDSTGQFFSGILLLTAVNLVAILPLYFLKTN
jgi:sugar phosphate permease